MHTEPQPAEVLEPVRTENTQQTYPGQRVLTLADPGKRILAYLVDSFIGGLIMMPFFVFRFIYEVSAGTLSPQYTMNPFSSLLNPYGSRVLLTLAISIFSLFVSIFLYVIVPGYFYRGQTFGKKLLGIMVVHANGGKADVNVMFRRYILYLVPSLLALLPILGVLAAFSAPVIVLINFILLFSDSKHQTLNDKFAETLVIEA